MADQYTSADALGLFLTGATSDGGTQPDPDLSFGNFRSSAREEQIGFFLNRSIPGVIVERIGGANGIGLGSLETVGSGLRWTAPNDTPGAAVAVANSETKMLQSAGDPAKYIVISRHTAADLVGSSTINLVPVFNNAVGSSNVPSGEALVKLRCLAMKNVNSVDGITNLKIWLGTLATQRISDAGQLGASGAGTIETTGTFIDWPSTGFCRITTAGTNLREIVYYESRTNMVLTIPVAGRGLLGTTAAAGASDDKLDSVPGVKIAKEAPSSGHFTVVDDEHDTDALENIEPETWVVNTYYTTEPPVYVTGTDDKVYRCIASHLSTLDDRPIDGEFYTEYWEVIETSGLSWSTAITAATGLDIGSLAAGEMIGIWVWLAVVEDRIASPQLENLLKWRFDITELAIELNESGGLYRIADETLERYELYRGENEEPDLEGEPYETFTELPHIADGGVSMELYYVLRRRNKFNLSSLNIKSWIVKLDADGKVVLPSPEAPCNISIVPSAGATGYVEAEYLYDDDDEYAATHWLIWFTDDGIDPDPENTPTIIAMNKANGRAFLRWTSPAADNNDTLKILVRTRLVSGENTFDSENTDIYSCTASDEGPATPDGRAFLGFAAEVM